MTDTIIKTKIPKTTEISRDASTNMNGYIYQRYYCIYKTLEHINNENVEYIKMAKEIYTK